MPLITRTCCRCGKVFESTFRQIICYDCRNQPKNPTHFSARQLQVLRLVADGKDNKAIAGELCLGVGTVKEYLNRLFHVVGARSRTQLAVSAIKHNFDFLAMRQSLLSDQNDATISPGEVTR